jgi:beta-phosphoglucomutase-like phosphatase (HAD superfamily)
MLTAVVFDFDGIILDSETPEFESHRRIYERCGVAPAVDEWSAKSRVASPHPTSTWTPRGA